MLFLTGNGTLAREMRSHIARPQATAASWSSAMMARSLSIAAACGFATEHSIPDPMQANFGPLGFLFPDASEARASDGVTARLDHMAADLRSTAMAGLPTAWSNFGQFISHDILAGTDRRGGTSDIDGPEVTPLPRSDVATLVANLRTGGPDLDSVYGGAALVGSFGQEMIEKMRCFRDRAKLAQGCPDGRPDLLRLARLVDPAKPCIDIAKLGTLPGDLRDLFLCDDGSPQQDQAIIGDTRNAEYPDVATIHLAFARLHNLIVTHADAAGPAWEDRDALFDWARDRVRWTYQWLIMNAYLPTICDPDSLTAVLADRAPIYGAFHARRATGDARRMPLPLEFTLAAFSYAAPPTARDALRIGHRLNLPTAQGCLDALDAQGIALPRVAAHHLPEPFAQATPLLLYVGQEAKTLGKTGRLGPLGSRLVAEVLVGLVTRGLDSYWTQTGTKTDRWHPTETGLPSEMPVDSLPALMRVAGLI